MIKVKYKNTRTKTVLLTLNIFLTVVNVSAGFVQVNLSWEKLVLRNEKTEEKTLIKNK